MARGLGAMCGALLSLAGFSGTVRAQWDPIPAQAWQEQARPDSGGGDAILLLDQSEYLDKQGSFRFQYFGRARVFTAEGRDLGNVEIEYLKDRWKITDLHARSVLANGHVTEFDPSQVVTTTLLHSGSFSVARASVAIPGVEPGCIIEWRYTLEGPTAEFGNWRFDFANRVYTCVSTHTWRPTSWNKDTIRRGWHYSGIQPVFVHEDCAPDCKQPDRVTFTTHGQIGVRDEELAPPADDATPRVFVFYGDGPTTGYWSEWKRDLDAVQADLVKNPGDLPNLVKEIQRTHPEPESALAETFRWVQGHIRSIEEPPWSERGDEQKRFRSYRFAASLKELMTRSEASPFEINCLMVEAARDLGLTAAVGCVGDRRVGKFDHEISMRPPFNFISVVNLSDRAVFLQPDSRFAPYGSVPWYLRGGSSLLTGRTSSLFITVPADNGIPATSRWVLRARMTDEGAIDGRIDGHLEGEESSDWRRRLWDVDPATWKTYLKDQLAEHGGPQTNFDPPVLDGSPDSEFVLRATAHWPNIASVTGDRVVLPLDKLIPWRTHARLAPERRKQSLLLRDRRVERFHIELHLAADMSADHLPDPQRFENDLGSWSQRWSYTDGVVFVDRELQIDFAELSWQDYRTARDFFRALEQADQTVLLVTKKP